MAAIQTEASQKQRECEADLLKAEPALVAAKDALNTLNRVNCFLHRWDLVSQWLWEFE